MPKYPIDIKYYRGNATFSLACYYMDEDVPALRIYQMDGQNLCVASLYLEEYDYQPNEIAIRDYGGNEGIKDNLVSLGLISPQKAILPTGFTHSTIHDMQGDLLAEWEKFKLERAELLAKPRKIK